MLRLRKQLPKAPRAGGAECFHPDTFSGPDGRRPPRSASGNVPGGVKVHGTVMKSMGNQTMGRLHRPPRHRNLHSSSSLARGTGEIVPEHYDICFNFLRHLFDLLVVGFLTTVSPPAKFILDVLGVQGALKLWLHGMAMFLVSSVGMAALLWVVQEHLLPFALIYGIVQALVISVSVHQSDASAEGDDGKGDGEVKESEEEQDDIWEQNEPQLTKGVKQ